MYTQMKKQQDTAKSIDDIKRDINEWKNKYLRALADYQNLEKRVNEGRANDIKFAARSLIVKLLPAIDDIERAGDLIKNEGLNLAIKKLSDILKSEQVEKIEVLGKKFDPQTMECIEVVGEEKGDEVVEEISPGYKMWDQVIRPAKVKVGKKKLEKVIPASA